LETWGEAERVTRRDVPREPDAPVRRTVSFSAFGYAFEGSLLGQVFRSADRSEIMRLTISVKGSLVSRDERRDEVGVDGGVKAATSFEIEGFSNSVPRDTGRWR